MIKFETKNYWYSIIFDKALSPWSWAKLYGCGQRRFMYFFLFMTMKVIDKRMYDYNEERKTIAYNVFGKGKHVFSDKENG